MDWKVRGANPDTVNSADQTDLSLEQKKSWELTPARPGSPQMLLRRSLFLGSRLTGDYLPARSSLKQIHRVAMSTVAEPAGA